jgi:diguanylate cyclase (GGDEF)-like protein
VRTVNRQLLHVLSIEDDPQFTELARRLLESEGYAVTIERVQSRPELERALEVGIWNVVLSDHSMPGFNSEDALRIIKAHGLDLPFIIVSGYIGEEAAVAAMRAGAHDYVPKTSLTRLGVAVRSALQDAAERSALRQRERDLEALHAVAFAAGRALDADRLAQFATERARELLACDTAALYWWRAAAGVLERIARSAMTSDPGIERVLPGTGMSGVAFVRREAVVVDDYASWANRLPAGTTSLVSAMATPLFIGDRVTGAFVIGSLTPRHFTPEEVRVLSVLAAEVAPAIESSHLLAEAQHAAHYDALTGLPNRVLFTERLTKQIEACSASGETFALLYADLDNFREINDAFGHDAGDTVLRELGVRLRGLGGIGDAVGRFGADEFGMVFPAGTGLAEAGRAAEGALDFLKQPFLVGQQPVHLAVSIGIVAYPAHGSAAETLLRRAESAMYSAKRSQTRYRIYSTELDPQSQRRIALASELRHAMRAGELVLYYQPQVECLSRVVVGAEALLRWRHPQRGLVPPMEFIPLAEQTGLILELTPWVVTEALKQARLWSQQELRLRLSVNVAMRNLHDPGFLDAVGTLLAASDVPPSSLTLEITEGTIMLEAQRALELLKGFRGMGVGVAIDDFGTGYSSLSYLSRLPTDEIKIDKSFVMGLSEPGNKAIVEAVTALGRAFDLRVVAEGVKDRETWDAMTMLGCSVAQGFHLSPPLPADAFEGWLRSWSSQL